jgi:hypothetical protein
LPNDKEEEELSERDLLEYTGPIIQSGGHRKLKRISRHKVKRISRRKVKQSNRRKVKQTSRRR